MEDGILRLNALLKDKAEEEFLHCCGSRRRAQRMVQLRPFRDLTDLQDKAGVTWRELWPTDWLEGFRIHPSIG